MYMNLCFQQPTRSMLIGNIFEPWGTFSSMYVLRRRQTLAVWYRLIPSTRTRARTRLTNPRPSTKLETTRRARSDSIFLSRRARPPLGTGKGTRARVVALHKCATRPATAAIDSVGPVPPTKIAKCIVIPRRAHSLPGHSHDNSAREGRVHKKKRIRRSINC